MCTEYFFVIVIDKYKDTFVNKTNNQNTKVVMLLNKVENSFIKVSNLTYSFY